MLLLLTIRTLFSDYHKVIALKCMYLGNGKQNYIVLPFPLSHSPTYPNVFARTCGVCHGLWINLIMDIKHFNLNNFETPFFNI